MSISALLDTSRRALQAHTQAIRITGDNIANVNTPGYSRRRGDFVTTDTQPGTAIGTGVDLERVVRVVDDFITNELRGNIGKRSYHEIRQEFLSRAEAPFGLNGEPGKIGEALSAFFSSVEDLATNPSDIALRAQVVQSGQNLVASIRDTYNQTASLQREADTRVGSLVGELNELSTSIAQLNQQIATQEGSGQQALTLRDQRDHLMERLSELVSFKAVDNSDGTNVIYLDNGFALVNGSTSRNLEFTTSPSFEPAAPNGYPPGLDGADLGHIVFDFGGNSHIDLTSVIRNGGGGEIAGLLALRGVQPNPPAGTTAFDADGDLVAVAARVEAITRDLLTRFNQRYLGPDEDTTTAGFQTSAYDLDGNLANTVGDTAGAFALFSFENATALANNGDIDNDGIPEASDIAAVVASGASYASMAKILTFNVSDPREFAAGRDIDPAEGALGTAQGDAQNIEALSALRQEQTTYTNPGATNTFSYNTTIEGMYAVTVSDAGNRSSKAATEARVAAAREEQTKELQASVSGVSLDEEFAKLITQQRAFQASARMITTGDSLFDEILAILG